MQLGNRNTQENYRGQQQLNYQQQMNQQNMQNSQMQSNEYAQTQNTEYQQSHSQQMNNQFKGQSASYNNLLDKTRKFKINTMTYALIGSLLFMCQFTTAFIIFFAMVFITEKDKDNEIIKILATLLLISLTISVGYSVVCAFIKPFSSLGYFIMSKASYDGAIYKFGDFIVSGLGSIKSTISWIIDVTFIVVGASEFNNIKKGKFKVPKFINKYFE